MSVLYKDPVRTAQ